MTVNLSESISNPEDASWVGSKEEGYFLVAGSQGGEGEGKESHLARR